MNLAPFTNRRRLVHLTERAAQARLWLEKRRAELIKQLDELDEQIEFVRQVEKLDD